MEEKLRIPIHCLDKQKVKEAIEKLFDLEKEIDFTTPKHIVHVLKKELGLL